MTLEIVLQAATLVLLTVIGVGLPAYIRKKAEGLATREDAAVLTRTIKEVESEFGMREARFKAILARDVSAHQLRFTTEFKFYRQVWVEFVRLRELLDEVVVQAIAGEGVSEEYSVARAQFGAAREQLSKRIERWRPFFAPEVNAAIFVAVLGFRIVAVQPPPDDVRKDENVRKEYVAATTKQIGDAMDRLQTAIRARLYADAAESEP